MTQARDALLTRLGALRVMRQERRVRDAGRALEEANRVATRAAGAADAAAKARDRADAALREDPCCPQRLLMRGIGDARQNAARARCDDADAGVDDAQAAVRTAHVALTRAALRADTRRAISARKARADTDRVEEWAEEDRWTGSPRA